MQFVTLGLAGEIYGIEIDVIQEILMDEEPTQVPNLPSFLKGIINIRHKIIPIVEGTERLGYPPEEAPPPGKGKIFTVEFSGSVVGIRVESAHEVIDVKEETIQSSPEMIERFGGRFVKGVVEYSTKQERRRGGSSGGNGLGTTGRRTSTDTEAQTSDSRRSGRGESQDTINIMLLDLDELFTGDELDKIQDVTESDDLDIDDNS